jgi:hypothetical protein
MTALPVDGADRKRVSEATETSGMAVLPLSGFVKTR